MKLFLRVFPLLACLLSWQVWGADAKKVKILDPLSYIEGNNLKGGYAKISIATTSEWEHNKVLCVDIDFAKAEFGGVNKTLEPNQLNPAHFKGLRFFAKSATASQIQVTIGTKDKSGQHLLYRAMAPVSINWSEVSIPFTQFLGSNGSISDSILSRASSLFISIHKRDNGESAEANLTLDNLALIEK